MSPRKLSAPRRPSRAGGRRCLVLAGAALLASALLTLPAGSAVAAVTHSFDSSFPVGPLGAPTSVAIDESSGAVYVLDLAGKLEKFDASGVPANFSSSGESVLTLACGTNCNEIAVDNSGGPNDGVIYISGFPEGTGFFTGSGIGVYLQSGIQADPLRNRSPTGPGICGVAVDSHGTVYAGHTTGMGFFDDETGQPLSPAPRSQAYVDRFSPGQWLPASDPTVQVWPRNGTMYGLPTQTNLDGRCDLAADSEGNQYYSYYRDPERFVPREVVRAAGSSFNYLPGPAFTPIDLASTYVSVDPRNDDVYSDREDEVARFDAGGTLLESFGAGHLDGSFGVAANGATGSVYATSKSLGTVSIFKATVTPDVAATVEAGATTALVTAHVVPLGGRDVSACTVEYGPTAAYGEAVACDPDPAATPFTEPQDIAAELTGLTKETTYHYRVKVTDSNGTTAPVDQTFTTHNVADLRTDAATAITQTSATLNGSFTNGGEPTSYRFEWGPTASYGQQTPLEEHGDSAPGRVGVAATIGGLSAYGPTSSPYHFRLVASNGAGTTYGPDRTFVTAPPAAPGIDATASSGVTPTSATLSAQVNPNGGEAFYLFEYGADGTYGSVTPTSGSIGSDVAAHPVSAQLSGLVPGTTYHYRALAFNFGGISHGPDQIFTTPDRPKIVSSSVSAVGRSSATLGALVVANASPTGIRFEYGTSTAYGSASATMAAGAGVSAQPIGAEVTGLQAGTTYHFRAVAENAVGSTVGFDQTFTTPPAAEPGKPRPKSCRKNRVSRKGKCVPRKKHHKRPQRSHRRGSRTGGR